MQKSTTIQPKHSIPKQRTSSISISISSNNNSFNDQQSTISNSHSRAQSTKSKRRTSKSLLPLDPKIYRIAHTGFSHSYKRPPHKKKRLIPLSSTGTITQAQILTDDQKTELNDLVDNNDKEKKKKASPKFISMRTFNIVKKTWSRKEEDKEALNNLLLVNRKKKRKVTNSKSNSHSKSKSKSKERGYQPKTHFSDVSGKSKRNSLKKNSNNNSRSKPIYNHNANASGLTAASIKKLPNNSKGKVKLPHVGNKKQKLQMLSSVNSHRSPTTSPNFKSKDQDDNKEDNGDYNKKIVITSYNNTNEGSKEHTRRKINNSFTFGKEPGTNSNIIIKQSPGSSLINTIAPSTPNNIHNINTLNNKKQQNLPLLTNSNKSRPKPINTPIQSQNQIILNLQPNFHPNNTLSSSFNSENLQSISNVNKLSINSVISKNILLNNQLQESLNSLIDNTQCVYCLKRVIHPITLQCTHELCIACAEEIISLSTFTKITQNHTTPSYIKCSKCHLKTFLPQSLQSLERLTWKPIDITKGDHPNEKLQICEICPNSKYFRDIAEFECLNCDILICYDCRTRHLRNDRHELHKIIQYHKIIQEKVELTLCDIHREPLKLYCMKDQKPICVICANYETGEACQHKSHSNDIKTIKHVLDDQSILLASAIREREGHIKIIEELMSHISFAVDKLQEEKATFFEKINKIYDELYEIIKKHEADLKHSLNKIFDEKIVNLNNKLRNFTYIKMRYDYYRNLICEKDIDIIQRVNLLTELNKRIGKVEQLALLKVHNINDSLINSQMVNLPIKDISMAMNSYKFLPVTRINMVILSNLFNESTIIHKEMILSDLVVLLPKIKSGVMLYQVSKDGASPQIFHQRCNNKGPTITIIKTVDGHIFGGFSNISWISESMYNESDESYLFKLGNGADVKGWKCPIKRYMKHHAIKQNEEVYSPCFGEIDSADLFISYQNLKNSYSNLGKVYKAPKGFDPSCFFAGKSSKWDIIEVEVYAVEVVNEEEYYRMVLK